MSAGHDVCIATHFPYEEFVRSYGLGFHGVAGDPESDMERLAGDREGVGAVRFALRNRSNLEGVVDKMLEDYLSACRGADGVVYTYPGFLGYVVARELELPSVGAFVEAIATPTRELRSALMPEVPSPLRGGYLEGVYNRVSHVAAGQLFWQFARAPTNRVLYARLCKGALPFRGPFKTAAEEEQPMVFGFSPSVLGAPADWPKHLAVSGFWYLDDLGGWSPPGELVRFLEDGPSPVSIGLGSIVESEGGRTLAQAIEGVRSAGYRAVVVGGWSGATAIQDADDVFVVDEIPYSWLFGRVAAAVHHGGAGTTASCLRAGVPQVALPRFHSQPFWASCVERLGVGVRLDQSDVSAKALGELVARAAEDPGIRRRSREISTKVSSEDGVGRAAAFIRDALQGDWQGG